MEDLGFNKLPEECISIILSHTSPSDVCRVSLVSSPFRSASESDVVWEAFLPSDYRKIVAVSLSPMSLSSKKELFFALSNAIYVDGGNKTFALEKSSGRISYTIGARELFIEWGNNPMYWSWKHASESRFPEVVELRMSCWLQIEGKIKTRTLSPNTIYGAYLIMKITGRAYGLDSLPSEITILMNNQLVSSATTFFRRANSREMELTIADDERPERILRDRDDGWMEMELGEFNSGEFDEEVKMSLMEVKGGRLKGGLVIEGIELRPKVGC